MGVCLFVDITVLNIILNLKHDNFSEFFPIAHTLASAIKHVVVQSFYASYLRSDCFGNNNPSSV